MDDEDQIQDLVYIEYQDGRIYKYNPNDPVDEEALANNRSIQCLMCHRCHPKMSVEYFTGQHDGQRYWYPVYLCLRAVERQRAEEDIDSDESVFDVSRFFAARITPPSGSMQESSPPYWYVDDPVGMIVNPSTVRASETINGEDQVQYLLGLRDRIRCDTCHNCTPRVVAIYKGNLNGTVLSHYRLTCVHLERYLADQCLLGWEVDETSHDEGISTSSEDDMPELEEVSPRNEETEGISSISTDDIPESEETLSSACRLNPSTSNGQRIQAMRTVHSLNVRRQDPWGNEQPKRSPCLQATLAAEVLINGVKALALFDSSNTTDSITPEFAFVTKVKQIKLEEQVTLQLGCVGSRSKISYGTKVPVDVGGVKEEAYFDLVNIDRYDCIIGTPFMNAHGVCLDFGNHCVFMKGKGIQALSFNEEQKYVKKMKTIRSGRHREPPRETAPIRKRVVAPSPSLTT